MARAWRRPLWTLGLGLCVAAALFALLARRPKLYEAEVGLLLTEGAFADDGRPRPRGELRAFVERALFGPSRLEGVIAKHDLGLKLGTGTHDATAARVRKSTEVRVWHDELTGYRQGTDPPRSARVTIAFSAPDPALALAVARDLGDLVARTQTERVTETAAARISGLRAVTQSAGARAAQRQMEVDLLRRELLVHPSSPSRRLLPALVEAARSSQSAFEAAANDLFDAELHARANEAPGRLVQVVDPGLPLWSTVPRATRLARHVALAGLVGGLLAVLLVGAFDPTIRDEQDLRRTRLRFLGRVPVVRARASRGDA